jgi:hypothetical protein
MVIQVQNLMNAEGANLAAIIASPKAATEDQRKAIALRCQGQCRERPGIRDPDSASSRDALHVGLILGGASQSFPSRVRARDDLITEPPLLRLS